ncbi:uncharacterized protein BJ212DRAFT_1319757 [Suillus subaureus]|uniref:Uncharacterized protein n=1 Tax=Suillus subaureus TaxID=48587 RepID=A0A9P7EK22_9AGAM|nr:uncharacterized protein BJ212DRAFT_1319757 [Suillus subaureus]KAG1824377.1 hypothetical protein BJ212DRAFT_1319757 [Suillus subaureus]
MSVTACQPRITACEKDSDCCSGLRRDLTAVSIPGCQVRPSVSRGVLAPSITACHHGGKQCKKDDQCCSGLSCRPDGDAKGNKSLQVDCLPTGWQPVHEYRSGQ